MNKYRNVVSAKARKRGGEIFTNSLVNILVSLEAMSCLDFVEDNQTIELQIISLQIPPQCRISLKKEFRYNLD
jgi:hypothetical protein